jgi:Domain of unknown function (DUF5615)
LVEFGLAQTIRRGQKNSFPFEERKRDSGYHADLTDPQNEYTANDVVEMAGKPDSSQLAHATGDDRTLLTCDQDFLELHQRWMREGRIHAGIVLLFPVSSKHWSMHLGSEAHSGRAFARGDEKSPGICLVGRSGGQIGNEG